MNIKSSHVNAICSDNEIRAFQMLDLNLYPIRLKDFSEILACSLNILFAEYGFISYSNISTQTESGRTQETVMFAVEVVDR